MKNTPTFVMVSSSKADSLILPSSRDGKMILHCLIAAVFFLTSGVGMASVPLAATLEDLVRGADHILVGRVVVVDMVDALGRLIADEAQGTGPGLGNTIRLHIAVDEVLITNAEDVPVLLKVPLDSFMHYRLGQVRSAHADSPVSILVLLKGHDFSPVIAGRFMWPLDDRAEALRLHAQRTRPRAQAGTK